MVVIMFRERDNDSPLTKEEIANKGHFCPEWDFDYIDKDFPEFESCLCFDDFKPENQELKKILPEKA